MKKKDLLILSHLRQNARESLTKMSKKTKIPISTIYERMKDNSGGLVQKHTALLNFDELGYMARAHIKVKVPPVQKAEIKSYLEANENVNSLYKINNGYDFLVEAVFRHIVNLEEFVEKIEEKFDITDKDVYYIVDDIKRESFMADPILLGAQPI